MTSALPPALQFPLMRITAIDTYIAGNPWKNWLFAKVSTDAGIHGVGEGTLNYFGKTIEAAIHELTPLRHHLDLKRIDRKSTRLNSSHQIISYAVFCLKKKINLYYHTIY